MRSFGCPSPPEVVGFLSGGARLCYRFLFLLLASGGPLYLRCFFRSSHQLVSTSLWCLWVSLWIRNHFESTKIS